MNRINDFSNLSDFLRAWDDRSPGLNEGIHVSRGKQGNISTSGNLDEPTSAIVTPSCPEFMDYIEYGVRDLVKYLVYDMGLITYSSCQGHLIGNELRLRNVGLLFKNQVERQWAESIIRLAAERINNRELGPHYLEVISDIVNSNTGSMETLEINFTHQGSYTSSYFQEADRLCFGFISELMKF